MHFNEPLMCATFQLNQSMPSRFITKLQSVWKTKKKNLKEEIKMKYSLIS